jgi:alkyl hydroperoxide reductase subunit AhpC
MSLRINDEAPNFSAETTEGPIAFHEWIGDGWAILFSHPKNFTPVCTTELGYMAGLQPEFTKRNCKIIGLSVDPVSSHGKWAADIEETQGHRVNYPLIGDPELKVAKLYDMLPNVAGTTSEGRTAANNATVRTVFLIGPDKKIKLMLVYPMTTGRNFDEVLRVLDSIQLTATHKVATPVNWKRGEDVITCRQSRTRKPNGNILMAGRHPSLTFGSSPSRSSHQPAAWDSFLELEGFDVIGGMYAVRHAKRPRLPIMECAITWEI